MPTVVITAPVRAYAWAAGGDLPDPGAGRRVRLAEGSALPVEVTLKRLPGQTLFRLAGTGGGVVLPDGCWAWAADPPPVRAPARIRITRPCLVRVHGPDDPPDYDPPAVRLKAGRVVRLVRRCGYDEDGKGGVYFTPRLRSGRHGVIRVPADAWEPAG